MFPKKGKVLPNADRKSHLVVDYASAIAVALKAELGDTHRSVKTAMRWTGASERTAKHWLSGLHGPSGAHLIVLARHSDHVMQTIIRLAGREGTTAESADLEIRQKLSELLELLESRFVSVRVITESAGYDGGSP